MEQQENLFDVLKIKRDLRIEYDDILIEAAFQNNFESKTIFRFIKFFDNIHPLAGAKS